MNNDPWYTRTEFWASLSAHLGGLACAFIPGAAPIVQGVGVALGLAAPIVYSLGRSNVKIAQAAGVAQAVANSLTAQAAPK